MRDILCLLTKSSSSNCGHETDEFNGLNRVGITVFNIGGLLSSTTVADEFKLGPVGVCSSVVFLGSLKRSVITSFVGVIGINPLQFSFLE